MIYPWRKALTGSEPKMESGRNAHRRIQIWKQIFICSFFSKPKRGLWSLMWSHTNLDVTLSSQVVDLCRLCLSDDLHQTHAVGQIAIVQLHVCQRAKNTHWSTDQSTTRKLAGLLPSNGRYENVSYKLSVTSTCKICWSLRLKHWRNRWAS